MDNYRKALSIILKIVLGLLAVLLIIIVALLWFNSYNTAYLNIEKNLPSSDDTHLIANVNVIPMDEDTIMKNKMVYIKDGVIEKIADTIVVEGIDPVDAKNKYLVPGLIDMHVHVWDRYELGLYLSNGVTAIRNLWGMPMHLRIKEDVNEGNILSPLFFTSGPKLTGREFIGNDNLNLSGPAEAKQKVISYKKRGYDFIKTYYGLDRDIFDAVIEQSVDSKIDIVAHPSPKVPFSYHLHPQIRSIEHAEEIVQQALRFDLDTIQLSAIIDSISKVNHISYCPTLTGFNNIYQMMVNDSIMSSVEIEFINPLIKKVDSKHQFERWASSKQEDPTTVDRIKEQHDFHICIVKGLHEAGVNIVCGTDAGIGITTPGFSIHTELAFYKDAGLSNYEVLRTATVNSSQTHEIMNFIGTIEEGKIANLLLTEGNPLSDLATLREPDYVFIKGKMLDRATLDSFNEKAKKRKNVIVSALSHLENLLVEK